MSRGDTASSSAAGQATVATRRESSPVRGGAARAGQSEHLLSRRKFGPQWAGALAGGVLVATGVYHGLSSIESWVRRRSPFPVVAENVGIHPDPPAWLVGAREKVLSFVPELTRADNPASLLTLDPAEISRRLRMKMPWIESVDKVVLRHPGSVDLYLKFRRPVMALSLLDRSTYLLDHEGVILPEADVSKPFLESLLRFNYPDSLVQQVVKRGGKAPADVPVGQIWEDERIGECLRLARFLIEKSQRNESDKPLFWFIDGVSFPDRLIVRTFDGLWIAWGRPPGQERPGEPDAATKWRFLTTWLEENRTEPTAKLKQSFLVFEKDRAVLSRGS
ncbi:hypothetical protein GC170_18770 [bacterium]|nr:hypothetical protein [bacterium]